MKKNSKTDAKSRSSSQQDNSLNESDSNKMRKSRRRLIQVLVAGGVVVTAKSVPNKWSRPVVEAVMLPAHAQTSGFIILGNNANFQVDSTQGLEQTESLLASGIEQVWGGIFDSLVANAWADAQPDCIPTGCSSIKYRRGDNNGQLFIGVFDLTTDSAPPTDLVLNFTDGLTESFSGTCIGPDINYQVELISDNLAKLTLSGDVTEVIDLVNDYMCEPVGDTFS